MDEKTMRFFVVTDRESENPALSNNGGDYDEGRTIAVIGNEPVAVRYWSSWDGGFCHLCGKYQPFECNCETVPDERDWGGWEKGEELEGERYDSAMGRLEYMVFRGVANFGIVSNKLDAIKAEYGKN